MVRLGVVGIGKIARDQHLPAIAKSDAFELIACASRNAQVDGVSSYSDLEEMLAAHPDLDAVAICTPPQTHFYTARAALQSGKHVLLEKPPCSTTAEFNALVHEARRTERTLFQAWHSRFAAGVAPARAWLAGRTVRAARITWREDARVWHPGQDWLWRPGGFGVFDPGVNALSILTEILADDVFVEQATLSFPANRDAPIAADLRLVTANGAPISAMFDFRETPKEVWEIEVETTDGAALLSEGGATLTLQGAAVTLAPQNEYEALYAHFAALIAQEGGASDADARPFQLVADAFLVGRQTRVADFN
jgi:predicted dehydrogenase